MLHLYSLLIQLRHIKIKMAEDYIVLQKFTDTESAEAIAEILSANGVAYRLQDNNHSYVKVYGYHPIDFAVALQIKQEDFVKAELILEKYYAGLISNINKDHYVFEMTNEELQEIIAKPFDWGRLDFQLAKQLLKERGAPVSDAYIENIKAHEIAALQQKEKAGTVKIITGYILALIIPIFAVFIGISIKYNRKILPNGERFYIHPESDRKHGLNIMIISIAWLVIFIIWKISGDL